MLRLRAHFIMGRLRDNKSPVTSTITKDIHLNDNLVQTKISQVNGLLLDYPPHPIFGPNGRTNRPDILPYIPVALTMYNLRHKFINKFHFH